MRKRMWKAEFYRRGQDAERSDLKGKRMQTKKELKFFLEADKIALEKKGQRKPFWGRDEIWRFQILLRKTEYFSYKKDFLRRAWTLFLKWKLHRMSLRLGFTIPLHVFGPGLSLAHRGTIIVNSNARVGANCRIHACVNIGTAAGFPDKAPRIGDNVYIGPGAKLFGVIEIAEGIAVGANAVVNKSFMEPNITIAGIPARKISQKGSKGLLVRATEQIEQKP